MMDLIVLEGSPRERGRIHGETLKPLILDHIGRWKEILGVTTGENPDAYIGQFLEDTDMLTPVERWTPDLLEEVRGIAEGTGVDFRTIFALNLSDEEWWYRRERLIVTPVPKNRQCWPRLWTA
jgi:hypothetical protein